MSEHGGMQWVIVGGGIHGTHMAIRLIDELKVDPQRLLIVDPEVRLLERWRRATENTGMRFLRSPSVHNLAVDPFALLRLAGPARGRDPGLFTAPYDRPSLALFNRHAEALIAERGLAERHLRGRAAALQLRCDGAIVEMADGGRVEAEQVVLAVGSGDQPLWPEWAAPLRREGRIAHVFDPGFSVPDPPPWGRVVVIGGGITAAQVALRLAADPLVSVTVVSRHPPRVHQFDSDPGWLGPLHMRAFEREMDPGRRRAMIQGARHKGSMPAEVQRALRRAIQAGAIAWIQGEVGRCQRAGEGLLLSCPSGPLSADFVLLATGFEARRPGGALVEGLISAEGLACETCGYPRIDAGLRWHPRVFVSGPLAELTLGPTARNIAGARRAAEAIVRAARAGLRRAGPMVAGDHRRGVWGDSG
ncbi:MAG: FAD/NAD(P)-binding protein [Nannocystis sp.]|nr:FAD/NAD(P)-binding protein [Nannocystis sp.]